MCAEAFTTAATIKVSNFAPIIAALRILLLGLGLAIPLSAQVLEQLSQVF